MVFAPSASRLRITVFSAWSETVDLDIGKGVVLQEYPLEQLSITQDETLAFVLPNKGIQTAF